MRVTCPACSANYDIPDQVVATGRKLRCARCAQEWVPEGDGVAAVPPPPTPPLPAAPLLQNVETQAAEMPQSEPSKPASIPASIKVSKPLTHGWAARPVRASRPVVAAAWVATLLILGGLGASAYLFRDTVKAAWPPSQRVYIALGLG